MKIAFYKAKGNWMNFLIRLKTKGLYSHTEIVFSDGVSFSSSQWDGGTRFKNIDYSKKENWDFMELNISKIDEKKIRQFCEKNNDKPYDWFAIVVAQIFNLHANKENKWFCSEVCTKALQKIKMVVGISAHMVSPQDLYELLLQEEDVKNRQWLHIQYLENRDHYFSSYWKVLYSSFAVLGLMFIFSYFIDGATVHAFMGSLLNYFAH